MSVIGNYIHYTMANYEKYGIAEDDSKSGISLNAAYNSQKKDIMNRIKKNRSAFSKKDLEEISMTITSFMQNMPKQAKNIILDDLAKHYSKVIEKGIDKNQDLLNWEKGAINPSKLNTQYSIGKSRKKDDLYKDIQDITNRINKIETIFLNKFEVKEQIPKDIKSALRAVKKEYKNTVGRAISDFNGYDFTSKTRKINVKEDNIPKLRRMLNDLIEEYAKYPNIVGIEGQAFEDIIALALNKTIEESDKKIDEVMDEALKGVQGCSVKKNTPQYGADKFIKIVGEDTFLEGTYNKRSKIDVLLKWKGKDAKISAKNVSFSDYTWIKVVEGTPLLFLMQTLDTNFVNHWINLHAIHKNKKKNTNDITSIDNLMKVSLFYEGISGDVYGSNKKDRINLIIVNDKKTGRVVVKDLSSMLDNIIKQANQLSVTANNKSIKEIKLQNTWMENSSMRIALILKELHDLKIDAKFYAPSFL